MVYIISLTNGVQIPDGSIINILASSLTGNQQITSSISVIQYDNTIPIVGVNLLTTGNKQYMPSDSDLLVVRMGKPDGHGVVNDCLGYDSNGTVYFAVTQQMTAASGMGKITIEITNSIGLKSSSIITINVTENPVQEGQIESTDEFKTLSELLVEVRNAIQLINDNQQALDFIKNNPEDITNINDNMDIIKTTADNIENINVVSDNISDVNMVVDNLQAIKDAPTYAKNASDSAILSKSWAIGGTGTREGEDTNNAKYYAGLINIDNFAEKNHASSTNEFGIGTSSLYGHLKLSDEINQTDNSSNGVAVSPFAVYNYLINYYDKNDIDDNFAPKSHADSSTQYGVGTTELFGHVKLSDAAGSSAAEDGIAATPLGVQTAIEAVAPDFTWHTANGTIQNCNGTYSFVHACYNTGAQLIYISFGILAATSDRNVVVASVALPSGYSLAIASSEIGALTKSGDNAVAENQAAGFEIKQSGTNVDIIETSTNPSGWAKASIMLPLEKS